MEQEQEQFENMEHQEHENQQEPQDPEFEIDKKELIEEKHFKEKKVEVSVVEGDGFICEVCCKVFNTLVQLNEHKKKVHSEKRYACHLCDKVCKSKDAIKKHQAVHTGERNYMCTHCGKAFADPSSRNQHEKYQHPSEENKIICKECGKQFKYPRNLKLHMVHHNQSTEYDGKKRQYSNELKVEALKCVTEIGAAKTAEKFNIPYSCVRNWVSAMKSSYPCTVCEKTFHSKQRLDDHFRTHHSSTSMMKGRGYRFPEEFKKEVVEYAATRTTKEACIYFGLGESTVRGFIKLLTNPLKCTHCDRKCKNQSQLEKHMDEVHKIGTERPYVPKQESLTQYLENENLEALVSKSNKEQNDSLIDPKNIEVYNPNVDGRSKSAKKPKIQEDFNADSEPNYTGSPKPITHSIFANLSKEEVPDNDTAEVLKVEADVDVKEEGVSDNEEFLENNEQYSDDDTPNMDDRLEDEAGGGIDAFMSTFNILQSAIITAKKESDEVDDLGTQVKCERKSIDNNQSENYMDIPYPNVPVTYRYNSPKEDLKHEIDSTLNEHGTKQEVEDDNVSPSTIQKKVKIKRSRLFPKVSEDQIDFSIDLKKYDINETEEEFLIFSKHMDDENFMNVMLSKKYKSKKKLYKCSDCEKQFKNACDLKRHLVVHSKEKNFLCEHCNTTFTMKQNLLRHIQMQHNEEALERYKCQYCGNDFKDKSSLKTHESKHFEAKPHQCPNCGVKYSSKPCLLNHIAVVHEGKNPIKHICPICGKQFRKTQNYKAHYQAHLFGKAFSCDMCGNSFQQECFLKTHKMYSCKNSPTIERPNKQFQCQLCEKVYSDNRGLQDHIMIVHEGKKDNFVCEICSKSFSRRTSLAAHKLLHTGEYKVYHCDNCSASFKDKRYLVRHQEKCIKNE